MKKSVSRIQHRTLGCHVSEALYQTLHYQALVDDVSVSELVRAAITRYLDVRGVAVATYAQIVGQAAMDLEVHGHASYDI